MDNDQWVVRALCAWRINRDGHMHLVSPSKAGNTVQLQSGIQYRRRAGTERRDRGADASLPRRGIGQLAIDQVSAFR
jgi:hypothetical protein